MANFHTTNPATGETLAEYTHMSQDEALAIAARAAAAQNKWRGMTLGERAPYFIRLAAVLREHSEAYATMMTREMGKPIKESRAEVEKCAWLAEFVAEKGVEWLSDRRVEADGKEHIITFDPLGVLFMIMPWNFPLWQPMKVAMLPLLAGNGVVLKHARNVTGCSLLVEEAFAKAGFPEHLFRSVIIDHDVMPAMLASGHIAAGSITGSDRAGALFASEAGKHVKKIVLELGGSDPLIVLDDADLDKAAAGAAKSRMLNAGQVCISAKRIIVLESVAEAFSQKFAAAVAALNVGDPMQEDTDIGPLVNAKAVEQMEAFVADAVAKGGKVLAGGKRADLPGNYFEPTVIAGADQTMEMVCFEVFGPVAPILTVKTEDEAIALANDSVYGLSGSVWSQNVERAKRVARRIETGAVFINSGAKSDPRVPIGGIKKSGYGRELSEFGALEFVNIKAINIYE